MLRTCMLCKIHFSIVQVETEWQRIKEKSEENIFIYNNVLYILHGPYLMQ